jgi:hypothetical protein
MYVRPRVYPNGQPIPASLPDSYQPAVYGNAPANQYCSNCQHFDLRSYYCNKWSARVKPRYWCAGWQQHAGMMNGHGSGALADDDSAIKVTVPLMIRLLEYAKEDAKTDMALHELTENLIDLSEEGDVLNMKNYDEIVGGEMETPDNTDNTETSDTNTQKVVLEIKLKGK